MGKRQFMLLICLAVLMIFAVSTVNAEMTCGDNLTWSFEDGLVEISGVGDMDDYGYDTKSPWNMYDVDVDSVIIKNGVTSIGYYAFYGCDNIIDVVIPQSVLEIDYFAFAGCDNLRDIYYSGTEEEWAEVFVDSSNGPLKNSTIHYNCRYASRDTKVCYDDTTVRAFVKLQDKYSGSMVLAGMYKNGNFVDVAVKKFEGEKVEFTPDCDFDEIKIMKWNSLEKLKPLQKMDKTNLAEQFGMLYTIYVDQSGIDETPKAVIYTADGKYISYDFARNVKINGINYHKNDVALTVNLPIGLITYTLNSKYQITAINSGEFIASNTVYSLESYSDVVYNKSRNSLGDNNLKPDTVIMGCSYDDYTSSRDAYFTILRNELADEGVYSYDAIVDMKGNIVSAMIFNMEYTEEEEEEEILTEQTGMFYSMYVDTTGFDMVAKALILNKNGNYVPYEFARNVNINGIRYHIDDICNGIYTSTGIKINPGPVVYKINSEYQITAVYTGSNIDLYTGYSYEWAENAQYESGENLLGSRKINEDTALIGCLDTDYVLERDWYFASSENDLTDSSSYSYDAITDKNGNLIFAVLFGMEYPEEEIDEETPTKHFGLLYAKYIDSSGIDELSKAMIYTEDGKYVTYDFAKNVNINGTRYNTYGINNVQLAVQPIMYYTNSYGVITKIYTGDNMQGYQLINNDNGYFDVSGSMLDDLHITDTTIIVGCAAERYGYADKYDYFKGSIEILNSDTTYKYEAITDENSDVILVVVFNIAEL